MQNVKWDELLNLYFSGETSLEQEKMLREYFSGDCVAPEYKEFIPLFSYMNAEAEAVNKCGKEVEGENEKAGDGVKCEIRRAIGYKSIVGYWKLAIPAAAVAVLLVGGFLLKQNNPIAEYELTIGGVAVKDEQRALTIAQDKLDIINNAMAMLNEQTEKISQTTRSAQKLKTLQIFFKDK